jgi:type IV pilus assembly protein PilV
MLSRGFTLLEVLITLVILMFGLLGLAGLMANGQRAAFEAYQRQQALAWSSDIVERMRANSPGAANYPALAPVATPVGTGARYTDLRLGAITNCAATNCDAQQLAPYDVAMWDGTLAGVPEQVAGAGTTIAGIVGARGCIEPIATTQAATCALPPPPSGGRNFFGTTYRVSVAWQGRDLTVAPLASNTACGQGQFGDERLRRVVFLDLTIQQPCP